MGTAKNNNSSFEQMFNSSLKYLVYQGDWMKKELNRIVIEEVTADPAFMVGDTVSHSGKKQIAPFTIWGYNNPECFLTRMVLLEKQHRKFKCSPSK